jgi:hypothetical protein
MCDSDTPDQSASAHRGGGDGRRSVDEIGQPLRSRTAAGDTLVGRVGDLARTGLDRGGNMTQERHRIYTTSFASVYPHYVTKAERKGRTQAEVDEVICWLTGYDVNELNSLIENETDFETFFANAPQLNPGRRSITGVVCGIRVEAIEAPLMQEIRYLDKLIDELAKGKAMAKILRPA